MQAGGADGLASLSADERSLLRGAESGWRPGQSLARWYPVALTGDPAELWWRFLGSRPFTESFFRDSLAGEPAHERLVCRTPLQALEQFRDSVPPAAFVFHVSRCGSTLLTQMLATLGQCVVMSEPPVLDAWLRGHHRMTRGDALAGFKGLVAALGQRRSPQERHLVVKLDSWHMPWIAFVREAFPDTPLVLLYRNPLEVLASHRRQRGTQMVPGLADTSALAPDLAGLAPADLNGYATRILEATFRAACDAAALPGVLLVNYDQLPGVVWTHLLQLLSIPVDAGQMRTLRARAGFHSKHTKQRFVGDPPASSGDAPGASSHYARLEERRRLQFLDGNRPSVQMM